MKGIVLAGGHGKRMYPITRATSKQLLPVYDKPLIYYSLSVLLEAGIRDILVISKPEHLGSFQELLGDGSQLGINIVYRPQPTRGGIAEAFVIGRDFIGDDDVALVLGDNVFHGSGFGDKLKTAQKNAADGQATIFGYRVDDPQHFGVVEFDDDGNAVSLEEKPLEPRSNYVVTGLYFYPSDVCDYASRLQPSTRGELEITDLNRMYLDDKRLKVQQLGRGFAWFDTGTIDRLFSVGEYIRSVQEATGVKVAALEEIAYDAGWIRRAQLLKLADGLKKTEYGHYLEKIALSTRR
ncbi:glucose-1-phosphate thymidylyltransferase RfbA [Coriobacteriaceae bacterium]|nr:MULTISPECIES: glucose-1-phosphate thymidylyltransferase RfbA [Atopobiaceae]MBF0598513.1 glucose-1-phosphate thymidylyltransferase RfbA [Atopobiaceae bacterium FL090493]TGY60609.1 glucose-1-phosphate thymidylyltransferase RfbA [Coriobacteriaceae bacterium]